MFPLTIFPLPGEMVPLHIFEPRYKQLLQDAESRDISFGIYFNHTSNSAKLGSLVKLESVIKRYDSGETDVIVKCIDLFEMITLFRTFKDKLYPGGEVTFWNVDINAPVCDELKNEFGEYLTLLNMTRQPHAPSIYSVANQMNLDLDDRLKFAHSAHDKREQFLLSRLRFQMRLLREAEKAKDVFHLN